MKSLLQSDWYSYLCCCFIWWRSVLLLWSSFFFSSVVILVVNSSWSWFVLLVEFSFFCSSVEDICEYNNILSLISCLELYHFIGLIVRSDLEGTLLSCHYNQTCAVSLAILFQWQSLLLFKSSSFFGGAVTHIIILFWSGLLFLLNLSSSLVALKISMSKTLFYNRFFA